MADRLFDRPRGPAVGLSGIAAFTVTITHPATGVTLVDPVGELDLWTRPTLDEHLERELRDPHHRHVVVDMNHLRFCGAAGCSSLLRARELASEQHRGLHVVPGRRVQRLLTLTELHNQFRTYSDLSSALAAARGAVRAATLLPRAPAPVNSRPELVAM
jgi:anti-anti-sigma factor